MKLHRYVSSLGLNIYNIFVMEFITWLLLWTHSIVTTVSFAVGVITLGIVIPDWDTTYHGWFIKYLVNNNSTKE